MDDKRLIAIIKELRKAATKADGCLGCCEGWKSLSEILLNLLHPVEALIFDRKLSAIVGKEMRCYLLEEMAPLLCELMPPQFVLGAVIQAAAEAIEAVAPLDLDHHLSKYARKSTFDWPGHWKAEPDKL